MKYNEFREAVERLGLTVSKNSSDCFIIKRWDTFNVMIVNEDCMYKYVILPEFYKLNDMNKTILYDLVTKYARTPLEERKGLTKYYIKHNFLKDDWDYLNYSTDGYFFSTLYDTCSFQTKFTQKEIDCLPMWIQLDLRDGKLNKVKVEE